MTVCGFELTAGRFRALPRRPGRRDASLPSLPWLGIVGPAFAISIGYIDPGNWATDIAAGSFGFTLLWVVLLANLMATALQISVVRLATLTGVDLATAMAQRWPKLATSFWCVFQGAAVATDLAEFGGVVLGLQLLLHWSMKASVAAGVLAVFGLLMFGRRESRQLEAAMALVLGFIALLFAYQLVILRPALPTIVGGLMPTISKLGAIPLIVGIIGATVMPHNLFLHSSLVLKNAATEQAQRVRQTAIFSKETWIALGLATFVNGAILVVGGSLMGHNGSIEAAFHGLQLAQGGSIALIFGGGLIASGIAASATATVAGNYVFRALAPWRVPPLVRRFATIVPAAGLMVGGVHATDLLIWSQIGLALILPAVVVPMLLEYRRVHRDRNIALMRPLFVGACVAGSLCIAFDAMLLLQPLLAH